MSATPPSKEQVTLDGVSETALLTLNARACEARRQDSVLEDPMAVALVDSIDYDFAKFGHNRSGNSQSIALRALTFDNATQSYLDEHPSATVVALAEGLQTSFWRLDAANPNGQFRWLTVDLPPMIDVRDRLLPDSPQISVCAQSALDYSWMDAVDDSQGVLITAEGLLMYLQPEQALELIGECAKRFPGGQLVFDLPPTWFSKLSRYVGLRTTLRYKMPPMPFSMSSAQAADLVNTVPGVRRVRDLHMPVGRGRGLQVAVSLIYRAPFLSGLRPCMTMLEFG